MQPYLQKITDAKNGRHFFDQIIECSFISSTFIFLHAINIFVAHFDSIKSNRREYMQR